MKNAKANSMKSSSDKQKDLIKKAEKEYLRLWQETKPFVKRKRKQIPYSSGDWVCCNDDYEIQAY